MQESVNRFAAAYKDFALTISIKKTEVLHQPAPGVAHAANTSITIDGQPLTNCKKFVYLGSTLSSAVNVDEEVSRRLARANAAFGRLSTNVWNRKGLSLSTKIKVYRAVILPSLLYASETWTVYSRHLKLLNSFHLRCLRHLIGVKWQDRVSNTEVLKRADLTSVHQLIDHSQLRWAGHVMRMGDERLPKQIFYIELFYGKRNKGGQRKRYRDSLKANLKRSYIDTADWEDLAHDRSTWRSIKAETKNAEHSRNLHRDELRRKRTERASKSLSDANDLACEVCGRKCKARIGLI